MIVKFLLLPGDCSVERVGARAKDHQGGEGRKVKDRQLSFTERIFGMDDKSRNAHTHHQWKCSPPGSKPDDNKDSAEKLGKYGKKVRQGGAYPDRVREA